MTLQDFIQEWTDKKCKFPTGFGGECMDLYRQYCKEVAQVPQSPPVKGAVNVWDNFDPSFDRIANTPTGVPEPGDIVIWGTKVGEFGHIAVFVSGTSKKFQSFDQNWPAGSLCHIQDHTYNGVLGWLHKKPESATTQPDNVGKTYTEEEMTKMRLERDENYNKLQTEVSNHEKDLTDIAVGIGSTNTVPGILARVKTLTDIEEQLRQAQVEAQKQQEKFDQEKADLQRQITELKGIIETKQKEYDNLLQRVQTLEGKVTNNEVKQTFLDKLLALLKG